MFRIILSISEPLLRLPFWPFVISATMVGVVLYVRASNPYSWSLVWRSTYSTRASQQLIREENILESAHSGVLVITFFFSLALFLYNVNTILGILPATNRLINFITILFSLLAIYVIKVSLLGLFQWIFQLREFFDEYLVGAMNINIILGVCLIPLNLLMIYGKGMSASVMLIIATTLYFLSFAIRYLRVVQMGVNANIYWYNIILYLCTLEIIPILLLVKMLDFVGINLNVG